MLFIIKTLKELVPTNIAGHCIYGQWRHKNPPEKLN